MLRRNKENRIETFGSQLLALWQSCSKTYLILVLLFSLLSAAVLFFCKMLFEGTIVNNNYSTIKWDNCVIHFAILFFIFWIVIFNKKIFSPHNINNRVSRFKQAFDRIISQGHSIQFYWLVSCFIVLFIFLSSLMGTFDAFGIFPKDKHLDWNPISLTYLLLTDTSTVSTVLKTDSHVANILVAICIGASLIGTLLFTGLLVSVFSNFLQRRVEDFEKGRLHYDLSDHIVFIGYDELLPYLVKQCAEYKANQNRKIVVQTRLPSEQVREDIKTLIADDALYRNIIFYNGRRDSVKDLMSLDLERASEIYVIGNRKHDNHDELNLQCLGFIKEIISSKKGEMQSDKNISLHLLIEDHTEYSKMKFLWDNEELLKVSLFNIYAIWAKALINGKYNYPLIKTDNDSLHKGTNIIIFGMSKYGSSIGIEVINSFKRNTEKTIISYICDNAFDEMLMFRARFSSLFENINYQYNNLNEVPVIYEKRSQDSCGEKINIEMEFIEANPYNNVLYDYLNKRNMNRYIFCCTGHNIKDLNTALFMPQKFISDSTLYVLQKHGTQFVKKLDYCSNFQTFGVLQSSINVYQYLHDIPNDSHERYDSYIETANIFENQGNWNRAIDYKEKAFNLSKMIWGEDSIQFANDNIDIGLLYERMDDYETAMGFFYMAYKIYKNVFGNDSLEMAHLEMIMGWCFVYQADFYQMDCAHWGEECFGRAMDIYAKEFGEDSQEVNDAAYAITYARESQR